jgi:hypothetical protein
MVLQKVYFTHTHTHTMIRYMQADRYDNTQGCCCLQVDLTLPEAEIQRRFPLFPGVEAAVEVTLEPGQCLYLPASWFHEVTSFGSSGTCMHVAVNYWFHPPDRLSCASDLAAEDAAKQERGDAAGKNKAKKKRKKAGAAVGEVVSTKKSRQGSVMHRVDECQGDSVPLKVAAQFPYKTDFWPSMWNARVERNAWPQSLKVPRSDRE